MFKEKISTIKKLKQDEVRSDRNESMAAVVGQSSNETVMAVDNASVASIERTRSDEKQLRELRSAIGYDQAMQIEDDYKNKAQQISDKFKDFKFNFTAIESRIAPINDLSVEICQEDDEQIIKIVGKDGQEFDLGRLLPSGCKFERSDSFHFDFATKGQERVGFAPTPNASAFILKILHEIGHAKNKMEKGEPYNFYGFDFSGDSGRVLSDAFKKMYENLRLSKLPKVLDLLRQLVTSSVRIGDRFTPVAKQAERQRLKAESERNAWAFALRAFKNLANHGFDVAAGFRDQQEMRAFIDHCLLSCDFDRNELSDYPFELSHERLNRMKGYKPIFVKNALSKDTDAEANPRQ